MVALASLVSVSICVRIMVGCNKTIWGANKRLTLGDAGLTKINAVVCTVGVSSLLCLIVHHVSLKAAVRRGCYLGNQFVLTGGKGSWTREQASWRTANKQRPHSKNFSGDRSGSSSWFPLLLPLPCADACKPRPHATPPPRSSSWFEGGGGHERRLERVGTGYF